MPYQITFRDRLVVEALVWLLTLARAIEDVRAAVRLWLHRASALAGHRVRPTRRHLQIMRLRELRSRTAYRTREIRVDAGTVADRAQGPRTTVARIL